jgi:UDP:flavonoid glycosyltransferase YjiC (YdhE family)
LPPRRNQLTTGNLSSALAAIAVSPAFVSMQPDWPSHLGVTGFCFWDTPAGWSESRELTSFLNSSKPVVAVSSGSISRQVGRAFERFYDVSIEAVRRVGGRALIIGAPADSLPNPLPADVLAVPFAPFSEVYPRCAAAIHHGGIGTTAQALRAGVPALVVPWGFDQFFTAAQVMRIGVGRWMSRRRFVPGRAAKALQMLLGKDSADAQRARTVAAQIAKEDGVANLCAGIEDLL